jgi:hypothetical protein
VTRHYRRLSLGQGLSLCIFGFLVGLALLLVAPRVKYLPGQVLLLFGSWIFLWFFSHDLAHHIIGRIVGVKFRYYFLGRSAITKLKLPAASKLSQYIPILSLKVDKLSLEPLSQIRIGLMYSAGAVASTLFPFLVLPVAYSIRVLLGVFFTLLTLANLSFTVYFSSRAGDLSRAHQSPDIAVSPSK